MLLQILNPSKPKMMSKSRFFKTLLFCLFLISSSKSSNAQIQRLKQIIALQDSLIELNDNHPSLEITSNTSPVDQVAIYQMKDEINNFWKLFRKIRDNEIENNHLKGSVKFGFSDNQTSSNSLFNSSLSTYDLTGGIELQRGIFPTQLEITTDFKVSSVNGQLTEDISNLDISFDKLYGQSQRSSCHRKLYLFKQKE